MNRDDPTTPLDGMPSHDLPTINRPASSPAPQASGGFTPGTILASRYRIVALLGRGGMGAVYRADDLRLGQTVALKFVDLGSDAQSIENLYHEVRIARQVSHPNVCRVHDVVEADGHRFIAMEYVDGEDLASLLRRIGRLPPAKATDITREIASGLAAAHERGITHRDLKPANVMIDGNGRAHVTDFGLASLAGSEDGRIAGTPAYMAPEQVLGQPVTPRSDVYALGLMMYELFTGQRVYSSSSFAERRQQRVVVPPPPSGSVKEIDPAIDALITACLAEDPSERPASARAVLAMLPGGDAIDAAVAAGETPSPEMIAAAAETGHLSSRVAWSCVATIVALLLLITWQQRASVVTLMRRPPEVFVDRAAEIVAQAGETSPAGDETYFFDSDRALFRTRSPFLSRADLGAIRPGVMRFVYRRSPVRMAPRETVQVANDIFIFQGGRVTFRDPQLEKRGDAIVVLDHHRGLVNFLAFPSGRAPSVNWKPLLESTGIEMGTLSVAKPIEAPPVASDAVFAWTASYPGQAERVRIEAAALYGKPAWLHVFPAWEVTKSAPPLQRWTRIVLAAQLVITIAITIVAIVVTRRSLRRGRSDRQGAKRLAFYLGGCLLLAWLIAAHHAVNAEAEARMIASGVGVATSSALVIWIFYMALEPGVRRTWPRSLIGWSRILAGNVRDAMVGREILFGIIGGAVAQQVFWLNAVLRERIGFPTRFFLDTSAIDPLRIFIGDQLISHVQMIEIPIGTMFAALLLRRAFGPRGGIAVFALLLSGYGIISPGVCVFMLLMLFALLRSGLLTTVAMGASASIVGGSLLTLDTAAWYWPRSLAVLLIVIGSAVWAARVCAKSGSMRLTQTIER